MSADGWVELGDGIYQQTFESWQLNVGLVVGDEHRLLAHQVVAGPEVHPGGQALVAEAVRHRLSRNRRQHLHALRSRRQRPRVRLRLVAAHLEAVPALGDLLAVDGER